MNLHRKWQLSQPKMIHRIHGSTAPSLPFLLFGHLRNGCGPAGKRSRNGCEALFFTIAFQTRNAAGGGFTDPRNILQGQSMTIKSSLLEVRGVALPKVRPACRSQEDPHAEIGQEIGQE